MSSPTNTIGLMKRNPRPGPTHPKRRLRRHTMEPTRHIRIHTRTMATAIRIIGDHRSRSSSDPGSDGAAIMGAAIMAEVISAEDRGAFTAVSMAAVANAASLLRFFQRAAAWPFPVPRGALWKVLYRC